MLRTLCSSEFQFQLRSYAKILLNYKKFIPYHATGFFVYPLETSENQWNQWFSDVFRGEKEASGMKLINWNTKPCKYKSWNSMIPIWYNGNLALVKLIINQ